VKTELQKTKVNSPRSQEKKKKETGGWSQGASEQTAEGGRRVINFMHEDGSNSKKKIETRERADTSRRMSLCISVKSGGKRRKKG